MPRKTIKKLEAGPKRKLIEKGNPLNIKELRKLARSYGRPALERVAQEINNDKASIALYAANTILNRGYGRPDIQVNVDQNIHSNFATVLTDIGNRMIAAGIDLGVKPVEAEYVESTVQQSGVDSEPIE